MDKFILRIHHERGTFDDEFSTKAGATGAAWEALKEGFKEGNRYYPARAIVFCEVLEKEEKI